MQPQIPAILLLGPTGSGKTPLGARLSATGICGTRCCHFDFGENLRQAVAGNGSGAGLSPTELDFLSRVLRSGALLEDRDFPLAQKILQRFLDEQQVDSDACVVLNGLPRHAGQASAVESMLHVQSVVCLECDAPTVRARIRTDRGGDRSGRIDDDLAAIERKLTIFSQRTAPLVAYYRDRNRRIVRLQVTEDMSADEMGQKLLPYALLDANP